MLTTTVARLVKRLRIVRAALTQSWHEHQCSCGATWFCMTAVCASEAQPVVDVCQSCESQSADKWLAAYLELYGLPKRPTRPVRVQ